MPDPRDLAPQVRVDSLGVTTTPPPAAPDQTPELDADTLRVVTRPPPPAPPQPWPELDADTLRVVTRP